MTARRQRALTAAMIGLLLGAFAPASAARPSLRARAASQIVDGIPSSRVENYQTVERELDGDGLIVRGRSSPAGVRFLYDLNPDYRYHLRVTGRPLEGNALLRVRLDESAPAWLSAPGGTSASVISGSRKVELLIYADTPFAYRISQVVVTRCRTWPTDPPPPRQILQDSP